MFKPEDHTFAICAYKENPFLETTLESLLCQEQLGRVIISTSTPNEHIEDIATRHDVELYINPNPRYAGDDWNYAYESADTPLVTVAHQDDLYDSLFLTKTLEAINSYPSDDVLIAFTDYFELRDDRKVDHNFLLEAKRFLNFPFRFCLMNGSKTVKRRVLGFGNPVCCPAITVNKSNAGPSVFDTTFRDSCDYQTLVNLANRKGRFVYISERLVGHRIYAESATSRNLNEGIRKPENYEILCGLWPTPIAKLVTEVYTLSERSNHI